MTTHPVTPPTIPTTTPVNALDQTVTDRFAIYRGDVCEVILGLLARCIGYIIFSPPFASLYTYSQSDRDLGNSRTHAEFYAHLRFLIPHLYRVLMRGRLLSFHCMQLPTSKERDGFVGLRDFRGLLIRAFQSAAWCDACDHATHRPADSEADTWACETCGATVQGFVYHSEVCIWKDPVTAMQRTKALGLLHKTVRGNASMSRQGIADYLVTMRRPGDPESRVTHDDADYPVSLWQRIASPIWTDIDPQDTLQHESAREHDDERHVCPLQLEVIRRGIELWTNPNDVVFSPFAGIGSEGWIALGGATRKGTRLAPRRFVGVELKGSYYQQAALNLATAVRVKQLALFGQAGPTP